MTAFMFVKYSFCCAENEQESPWEPLHVERGFARAAGTVTVVGTAGTTNMNTHAKDADDVIRVIADTMAHPTSNDYWIIVAGSPGTHSVYVPSFGDTRSVTREIAVTRCASE